MRRSLESFKVMDDPELDRLFTEAYKTALSKVEGVEKEKRMADHIDAYAELFERDLRNRDLSTAERQQFVAAFKRHLSSAKAEAEKRRQADRRRLYLIIISVSAFLTIAGVFFLSAQPFRSAASIETELAEYFGKVDQGTGAYAKKYYALLEKRGAKLGTTKADAYRSQMDSEVDEHFIELLAKVEAGELQYADDAKAWADNFPNKEDRDERRRKVDNAFQAGLGKAVGSTWDSLKKEAGSLLEEAGGVIKKVIEQVER